LHYDPSMRRFYVDVIYMMFACMMYVHLRWKPLKYSVFIVYLSYSHRGINQPDPSRHGNCVGESKPISPSTKKQIAELHSVGTQFSHVVVIVRSQNSSPRNPQSSVWNAISRFTRCSRQKQRKTYFAGPHIHHASTISTSSSRSVSTTRA
jgi:hypothetical protein